MAVEDESNNKVIISRIQQRRGLKQDLPQPLRPGEIGFASDTRQVYIGADTDDALSNSYNKVVEYERTLGAETLTSQLVNTNIIKFTVPHKKFEKSSGSFDGTAKEFSWYPNTVFRSSTVNSNVIINSISNNPFGSGDVSVVRNGVLLKGDSGNSIPASGYDYSFTSGNNAGSLHTITFSSPPQPGDEVSIAYYANTAIINSFSIEYSNTTPLYSLATIPGPYTSSGTLTPESLKINSEMVLVSPESGTGFIGLESKHLNIYSYTDSPNYSSPLGNLVAVRDTVISADAGSNFTLQYDSGNNIIQVETAEIPLSTNVIRIVSSFDGNVSDFNNVSCYCLVENSNNIGNSNIIISLVNGFVNTTPDLGNANLNNASISSLMIGQSIDLSSVTSSEEAIVTINNEEIFLKAVADSDSQGNNFKVFSDDFSGYYIIDDSSQTASSLNFLNENGSIPTVSGEIYLGTNLTVANKIVTWIKSLSTSSENNIISSTFYNSEYGGGDDPWTLNLSSAGDAIEFDSASEASNFAKIVNKLYYANNVTESSLTSSKGLVNIKTNIEMLTVDAFLEEQASAESDIIYNLINTIDLSGFPSDRDTIRVATETRDAMIIDYSIRSGDGVSHYTRIGTLHAMIHQPNSLVAANVVFNDIFSEEMTGAYSNAEIVLNAAVVDSDTVLEISIDPNSTIQSTIFPSGTIMKYTVRGWLSN